MITKDNVAGTTKLLRDHENGWRRAFDNVVVDAAHDPSRRVLAGRRSPRPRASRRNKRGGDPVGAHVNRRGLAMMSSAHLVDDLYQGVVPALLPFFVAQRHYSYASVAGLTLAATILSSVAQPAFGWWTDRHPRRWLITAGMSTAAAGVGLAGFFSSYVVTWLVIALGGLGIAAFHPEAARAARQASGDNNRAMSIFALGGNVGFAAGSLVATPVLLVVGLHGTALLVIPAIVTATILATRLNRILDGPDGADGVRRSTLPTGTDDWPAFLRLTSVVLVRSVLFAAVTSFLALYFIHHLGASTGEGGAALTVFLVSGACGTLVGGWVADRTRRLTCVRFGLGLAVPALAGLLLAPNEAIALLLVAVLGVGMFMPFAVFVMLSQDYLPNRIGTASGLTVGLAVSVGGLFSPLLGWLADVTSLRFMFSVLIALPVIALLLATSMHDPQDDRCSSAISVVDGDLAADTTG
jgi:MFS transporter, FSR family, fosmidomycin resistance protein